MSSQKKIEEVKKISLFRDFSDRDLSEIAPLLHEDSYRKGQLIFSEGDPCEKIFIVRSGRIKVFHLSASGREQILEVLEKGDTCACNPGSTEWSCTSSAQALTACVVWALDRHHYAQVARSNSKLMQMLNEVFARRLCKFCSLIEAVSLESPQKRVAKFLLDLYREKSHSSGGAEIRLTQEEISQRLGLVRETVSRHLNRLKKAGIIDIQSHRIIVSKPKELQKVLD